MDCMRRKNRPTISKEQLTALENLNAGGIRDGNGRRRALGVTASDKAKLFSAIKSACHRRDCEKIEQLFQSGICPNDVDDKGELLQDACVLRYDDLAELLIRYGANLHVHGDTGMAPIHVATRNGCMSIVKMFLDHNAQVNFKTKYENRVALHHAVLQNHYALCKCLLEHSADVNARDIYGSTPLHLCSALGRYSEMCLLLESGGDFDVYDNEGWTPLHIAAEAGHYDIANLLIENNANIDSQTKYGRTALHWACVSGHTVVAEALAAAGTNLGIKDAHGKTAYDCCTCVEVKLAIEPYWRKFNLERGIEDFVHIDLRQYVSEEDLLKMSSAILDGDEESIPERHRRFSSLSSLSSFLFESHFRPKMSDSLSRNASSVSEHDLRARDRETRIRRNISETLLRHASSLSESDIPAHYRSPKTKSRGASVKSKVSFADEIDLKERTVDLNRNESTKSRNIHQPYSDNKIKDIHMSLFRFVNKYTKSITELEDKLTDLRQAANCSKNIDESSGNVQIVSIEHINSQNPGQNNGILEPNDSKDTLSLIEEDPDEDTTSLDTDKQIDKQSTSSSKESSSQGDVFIDQVQAPEPNKVISITGQQAVNKHKSGTGTGIANGINTENTETPNSQRETTCTMENKHIPSSQNSSQMHKYQSNLQNNIRITTENDTPKNDCDSTVLDKHISKIENHIVSMRKMFEISTGDIEKSLSNLWLDTETDTKDSNC